MECQEIKPRSTACKISTLPFVPLIWFCQAFVFVFCSLVFGPYQWCSEITPGSASRNHSCWCLGEYIKCQELGPRSTASKTRALPSACLLWPCLFLESTPGAYGERIPPAREWLPQCVPGQPWCSGTTHSSWECSRLGTWRVQQDARPGLAPRLAGAHL